MPLTELGLRRLWSAVRSPRSEPSGPATDTGTRTRTRSGPDAPDPAVGRARPTSPTSPACSLPLLPLLQVWPSQDSPRGEADGQSFVFPEEGTPGGEPTAQHDSGIDSVQVSPSPGPAQCPVVAVVTTAPPTTSPSPTPVSARRPSSALLHPDHARLLRAPSSPDQGSVEDVAAVAAIAANVPIVIAPGASCSSSTTSSLTSVAAAVTSMGSRTSDPWLQQPQQERRRSSTMTARYSLLDALDLEYALLRAAARGSVGPYSLSESLHKLTFTQSLAFPALARGLAGKRRRSDQPRSNRGPLDGTDSGLNAFAKVVTALVLVLVSVLVFGVVYKFVRT